MLYKRTKLIFGETSERFYFSTTSLNASPSQLFQHSLSSEIFDIFDSGEQERL